jgi:hypothetical protein
MIRTEHLCDFRITFDHHEMHTTPLGTRLTMIVNGGSCEGPRLNGEFVPGGGDWITIGADGVARLDVRATLRADGDALIHLTNTGRASLDDAARARFLSGELVRADEMYARSSPLFETGDPRYEWLNSIHTIAVNEFSLHEVRYQVHAVL